MSDFYCREKFTFLSVDVEKRLIYSCCTAYPEKVDIKWLKRNPGQLFNTPLLQSERQSMLNNTPVASCEESCWRPEKNGITSRRIWVNGTQKTHTDIQTTSPTTLSINLGSSCNLTCSYCCKQYSSAWRRDVMSNGSYIDSDRFNITSTDLILSKVSHAEHISSPTYQLVMDEIQTFDYVKRLVISGGEPFLYNGLDTLLNRFSDIDTQIYTGLGVNPIRFKNQISKIKNKDHLLLLVSAENCKELYEFNRYGNKWDQFLTNLNELQNQGFHIKFSSVISNLTIFGLPEFIEKFADYDFRYNWCNEPDYLGVNVLDETSKEKLITLFESKNFQIKDSLISSMQQSHTEQQKQHFLIYISEFARRRNLSLAIYPESMLQWLNIKGS